MGLARHTLKFLVREHKRKSFSGSLLTLGRQSVHATETEVLNLFQIEGIMPIHSLLDEKIKKTNIPSWIGTPQEKNISDVYFFQLLGFKDVKAIDYSNFETAEIVHDLNKSIAEQMYNQFDIIIDGGTIEHVFDVRQCLKNLALMLKPGGRIIHITPTNNYVQHGFYQFSPTLFFDFYHANRFVDLRGFLVEHDRYRPNTSPWNIYQLTGRERPNISSKKLLLTLFVAEKTSDSTVDAMPIQSLYEEVIRRAIVPDKLAVPAGILQRIKQMIPRRVKLKLFEFKREWLVRFIPWIDHTVKPWGLKRWGLFR